MRLFIVAAAAAAIFASGQALRAESERAADTSSSTSCGRANRGSLANAARLPAVGDGFVIVEPWLSRRLHYGTDELVGAIERAARHVADTHDGSLLAVADMSAASGGAVPGHRSHQSGRDADLVYYALDRDGNPLPPDGHMAYYRSTGRADYARSPKFTKDIPVRYFDMARNWELVKALVTDEHAGVSKIFVSWRVRTWLLEYAEAAGEPDEIVESVKLVLKKPRDSKGHNDHLHVRVGCSEADKERGDCRDKLARKSRGSKWRRHVPCPVSEHDRPTS